jgi:AraC family transcriptional regulator
VTAYDCVCAQGREVRGVERYYPTVEIAVVTDGAFAARSRDGTALVAPGALLLKNAGVAHEYRHVDDGGDRCVVFAYDAALVDDLRASLGLPDRGDVWTRLHVPASADTAAAVALAVRARDAGSASPERAALVEDAALAVAAAAARAATRFRAHGRRVQLADQIRVARTLRYVDAHSADDCSLATLAAIAGLSPFHYARVVRAVTGQSPRQLVIAARLRAAATALARDRRATVTGVAAASGFGDLSHFTATFRRAFGQSPARYRAAAR